MGGRRQCCAFFQLPLQTHVAYIAYLLQVLLTYVILVGDFLFKMLLVKKLFRNV